MIVSSEGINKLIKWYRVIRALIIMIKVSPVLRALIILFFGAVLSLGCVLGLSSKGVLGDKFTYDTAITISSLLLTLIIPVGMVIYSLITCMASKSKVQGLSILLLSYFTLILSFGSGYYTISWAADLSDTSDQYYYYNFLYKMWPKRLNSDPPPRMRDERAFKGMRKRLWSGIEDYARPYYLQKDINTPTSDILIQIKQYEDVKSKDEIGSPSHWTKYCAEAKWEVFLDCLHYSIVTIATVGYGDIAPQSRAAKIMTDIEIVAGQILFVFALGIVFGKQSEPQQTSLDALGKSNS